LDKAVVLRVIQQRQSEYQKCYTEALGWNPNLKGRLVIRFTVEADGEVSSADEQITPGQKFPEEIVSLCVADEFRQLRFPSSPEAFQVVYPLVFTPKPSKPQ